MLDSIAENAGLGIYPRQKKKLQASQKKLVMRIILIRIGGAAQKMDEVWVTWG